MSREMKYYLVSRKYARAGKPHQRIIYDRPTPWKPFLRSLFRHASFGFTVVPHDVIERLHSRKYAYFFTGNIIRSDGDCIFVMPWSWLTLMKFCLEGFQYGTFLRVWRWSWDGVSHNDTTRDS